MKKAILLFWVLPSLLFAQKYGNIKPLLGEQINFSHPIARGLVGVWLFNEGSGNKVFDLSLSGIDGAFSANMTEEDWVFGRNGYALDFDGSSDWIDMGNIAAIDGIGAYTISLWVKTRTSGLPALLDFLGGEWNNSTGLGLFISLNYGTDDIFFGGWSGSNWGETTGNILPADTWTHIVGRFDGSGSGNADRLKIYANGIEAAVSHTGTIPTTTVSAAINFSVGSDAIGANNFPGFIDDVRIWSRALSETEIWLLYINPYAMFEQPLYGRILAAAAAAAPPTTRRRFIITNDE